MKKILSVLALSFLLGSIAHADVTGYNNGTALGRGEEANFANGLGASRSGEKFTIGLFGVANGGASQVESVAALPLSFATVGIPLINSAGAVYTLAAGTPGQIIQFYAFGKVASDTAVITPSGSTGFTTATLSNNGSTVVLQYINSTVGWIVLSYDNSAVS